ncbi:hypothetical protein BUALT_Bualt03G0159200 [Buddleja alternifolia]|uniref:Interactor of constitutive active ROPs 1 n=1 Tax=Buddleja alternifolia TaxID=168488 RepID=A0AAV6Y290_9LAMI|nr:hypothetical protein BUALT_Bualt03G0159200 [Buddleja alternifolia]
MRRSRVTEMAQRQPPRNLRSSTSSSDNRPKNERSIKLNEGRSPRGPQSDPANKKKLGTRIADLESQLGLAQEELKSLKNQIVSVEAAKTAAQEQLDEKQSNKQQIAPIDEISDDVDKETDVFEVPMEKVDVEPKNEQDSLPDEVEIKPNSDNSLLDELALKNDEINLLKTNLDEKQRQLGVFHEENERLKSQLDEKSLKISLAQFEIEELSLKLKNVDHELEKSKRSEVEINEKLEASEKAKEELEDEMKKSRVQTEQWRKAADAAASVLAGGVEMNGRRVSERFGSMDKHYGNGFGPIGGYTGYVGSPGLIDDDDDDFGSGKRKGIRMFGELWKKKGQK